MTTCISNMMNDMHRLNGKCNLYTSVQSFPGQFDLKGLDYSKCLITLIPLDFDGIESGATAMLDFHIAMDKENLRHVVVWSGGGAHGYVLTEPYQPKYAISCIAGAQDYIGDLCGHHTDPPTRGRPDQIFRLPYTLNVKRKLFCTPLSYDQIHNFDISMATKPNKSPVIFGGELLNLSQFDDDSRQPNKLDMSSYIDDTTFDPSITDVDFDRACIESFINKGEVGNTKRYWFFMHLKDKNLRVEEAIHIARVNLHGPELEHSIHEGQVGRIWNTGYRFPAPPICCERLKVYCKRENCTVYKDWSTKEVYKYV